MFWIFLTLFWFLKYCMSMFTVDATMAHLGCGGSLAAWRCVKATPHLHYADPWKSSAGWHQIKQEAGRCSSVHLGLDENHWAPSRPEPCLNLLNLFITCFGIIIVFRGFWGAIYFSKKLWHLDGQGFAWCSLKIIFSVVRDCDERRRSATIWFWWLWLWPWPHQKRFFGWEQCNLCSCGFIKWLKINLLSRFNLLSKNMWGLKEQDQDGHGNTGWPWTRWRPGLIKLTKLLLLIVGYLKKFILVSKQIQI